MIPPSTDDATVPRTLRHEDECRSIAQPKEASLTSLLLGLEVSLLSEGNAPSIFVVHFWLTEDGDLSDQSKDALRRS